MKKWIALVVCLLTLTVFTIPASAAGSVSFSASASQSTVEKGGSFTISVSVSGNTEVTNAGVYLDYDSSVFEYVSGNCTVSGATFADASGGLVYVYENPTVYSGSVGTLTLKVKNTAKPGVYMISGSASAKCVNDTVYASGFSVRITVPCTEHNYGSWTPAGDGHQKVCSECGDKLTQAHNWDNGEITVKATCAAEGTKTYTCTDCKATKTESVEKLPHMYGALKYVDENNHVQICAGCGDELQESHIWAEVAQTKPATCQAEGIMMYSCPDCQGTKTAAIPVTDHAYGPWTKVDEQNHTHTCTVCQNPENAAHNWNEGTITKKPTCKDEGIKTITCPDCGASKTEPVPPVDTHTWKKWEKVDADTHKRVCSVCEKEETGSHTYAASWKKDSTNHWHECSVCADKKDLAIHEPGPEATETTAQTCKVCQYIINPALAHTHEYAQDWTVDETGHWHACSGCEEKGEFAPHDFENDCDPDCTICAYVRETAHIYGEEWVSDVENHWHVCTGCGDIQDLASHIPGTAATETEAQTCTICAFEMTPALREEEETEAPSETDSTITIGAIDDVQDGLNQEDHKTLWTLLIVGLAAAAFGLIAYLRNRRFG